MSNRDIVRRAWRILWARPIHCLAGILPYALYATAAACLIPSGSDWQALRSLSWVFLYPLIVGQKQYFLSLYRGELPSPSLLFFRYTGTGLAQALLAGAFLQIPPFLIGFLPQENGSPASAFLLLLALVAGLAVYLKLFLLPYVLINEPERTFAQALADSFRRSKGFVSRMLRCSLRPVLLMAVLFLPWVFLRDLHILLDFLTFGVACVVGYSYFDLCTGGLSREVLSPGQPLPEIPPAGRSRK